MPPLRVELRRDCGRLHGMKPVTGYHPHRAGRPVVASAKLDAHPKCGLFGGHRERESRRAAVSRAVRDPQQQARVSSRRREAVCSGGPLRRRSA